jgi:AcrR family transcriptional regulator
MATKAEAKHADPAKPVIEAALRLAAERGWADLALADIAAAAKLPLANLYASFPSKTAILAELGRQVDRDVLAGLESGSDESTRDRLFDLIMKRFDVLSPYRDGLSAVARDLGRDPLAAVCGLGQLARSMALMLEAAGVSSSGLAGALRTKGLGAIYLATMRDWFRDDSADKARTIAALDARLRRAESWIHRLDRRGTAKSAG